jgi:nucleotide-binding universal stress UspA family protein
MSPYRFTNILVAIDGSDYSDKALDCALSLASALEAGVTALAVEGKLPAYAASLGEVDEVKREKDAFFEAVIDRAREAAAARGIELFTARIPGHAAEVISHYAKAHGHDLIVVGQRGHFLGDYLLGSTADRVAHHAHCPVMIVR